MSSRRSRRKIINLVLGLAFVGLAYYTNAHPQQATKIVTKIPSGSYEVVEFSDGDTITVDMNGTRERIRMTGVDTPETKDPRKAVECFGQAASNFTKQLIGDGPVRLEADTLSTNRDRYDRLLRYVYTSENKLVQAEIIKEGYGFAYVSFPFSKLEEFRQYEMLAREQNKGLWSGCQPYLDTKGYIHTNPAQ